MEMCAWGPLAIYIYIYILCSTLVLFFQTFTHTHTLSARVEIHHIIDSYWFLFPSLVANAIWHPLMTYPVLPMLALVSDVLSNIFLVEAAKYQWIVCVATIGMSAGPGGYLKGT